MSITTSRPMARRDEGSRVPGPLDKAAIILLALDEERSQRLFAGLEEDEIRRISRAMSRLGHTPLDLVEQTVGEFRAEVGRTGNVLGTADGTEKILLRIMPPEKVAEIMGGIKGPDSRAVWEKLANISPPALASYLRNEYPQTAAVILGRLPPQHAARVLGLLPEPLTGDVAVRMVRMDSIHQSVLSDIEETLEREFVGTASGVDGTDSASGACRTAEPLGSRDGRARAGLAGGKRAGSRRAHPPDDVHLRRPGASGPVDVWRADRRVRGG